MSFVVVSDLKGLHVAERCSYPSKFKATATGAKGLFAAQAAAVAALLPSLAGWRGREGGLCRCGQDGLTERSNLWFKSRAEIHSKSAALVRATLAQ